MNDTPDTPAPTDNDRAALEAFRLLMLEDTTQLAAGRAVDEGLPMSLEQEGDSIERYKLQEVIGTGGFGIVWRAEQMEPIRREVALKVIKPGMDSHEIIARFEAERQALALMDHPNIAAVLDAGATDKGRPYFVMELVNGIPITDYCDAKSLTIRERLELFLPVCLAVQHAHQKGILHRDLKPSNILVTEVDGKAVPKVIDFGIAKALSTAFDVATQHSLLRTQAGMVVGTPQYMSPEQAGTTPDLDTRSDIYTLGVILYELLTGCTPISLADLKQGAVHEVLRLVREAEPARPSSRIMPLTDETRQRATTRHTDPTRLTRALSGDLDWITLTALEKDRERRYASVTAFARDLERHLNNEPIEARPPSGAYRFGKWVKRNKAAFAAAAMVLLSLIAGLAGSLWQAHRASKAEALAQARQQSAERARDAAEDSITEMVVGLRAKLSPLGKLSLLQEAVDAADGYFQKLPPELVSTTTIQNKASLHINQGFIALISGRLQEGEKKFKAATVLIDKIEAMGLVSESLQKEACMAELYLGFSYANLEDHSSLARVSETLRARCQSWLQSHPDSRWALSFAVMESCMAALHLTLQNGQALTAGGRVMDARKHLATLERIAPGSVETLEARACVHFGQAFAAIAVKASRDTVIAEFEACAAAVEQASQLWAEDSTLRQVYLDMQFTSITNAGYRIYERGREQKNSPEMERGRSMVIKGLEGRKALVESEPNHAEGWKDLAVSHQRLSDIARAEQDIPFAAKQMDEAVRCAEKAVALMPDRPTLHLLLSDLLTDAALLHCQLTPPDPLKGAQICEQAIKHRLATPYAPGQRKLKSLILRLDQVLASSTTTDLAPKLWGHVRSIQTLVETELAKATEGADKAEAHEVLAKIHHDFLNRFALLVFQHGQQAGDAAEMAQGKAMVTELYHQRKKRFDPSTKNMDALDRLRDSSYRLSTIASAEKDVATALAFMLEAAQYAEKALQLEPANPKQHGYLADHLYDAVRLAWQQEPVNRALELDVAMRAVRAWFTAHDAGLKADTGVTLNWHVHGVVNSLRRSLKAGVPAPLAECAKEIRERFTTALTKTPGEQILLSEQWKFLLEEGNLYEYHGEAGSRIYNAAGDQASKQKGREMIEQAAAATRVLCVQFPNEGSFWRSCATSLRIHSEMVLKEGDSARAFSLLKEAVKHAEKAAALMTDQPITRHALSDLLYNTVRLAWEEPEVDTTLCMDLAVKAHQNWLLAHEQGYRADNKTKLSSHVWLVYESLKLVLKTPEKATIPQRLDEVKALLDEALRKAPDDPMLLEGITKFKEYEEVLRRMAKESRTVGD